MELIPGLPDEIALECLIRVSYHQFPAVGSVCKRWREELHSPDFHRQRRQAGRARRIVALTQADTPPHSLGLLNKYPPSPDYHLALYDDASGDWSLLPPLPGGLPIFCQVAAAGSRLVVVGGWSPETWEVLNEVHVYDFLVGRWRRGATMPGPPRSFFACASDGERCMFVAGGHDHQKTALRSAMVYDVSRDEWAPLPSMAQERDECRGAFVAGEFRVVGGYRTEAQGQFEQTGDAFNVAAMMWGPVAEDELDAATCPRTYVVGVPDGRAYRCRAGHLAVKDGGGWRWARELPVGARVGSFLVTWHGMLMVIGSARLGGPHRAYTLSVVGGGGGGGGGWTAVEVPREYSGHVQAGCCLEI